MDLTRLLGDTSWSSPTLCRQIEGAYQFTVTNISNPHRLHPIPTIHSRSNHSYPPTEIAIHANSASTPLLNNFKSSSTRSRRSIFPRRLSRDISTEIQDFARVGVRPRSSLVFSQIDVERLIGLVLPPTLVMMDDWEPAWRVRGVVVLESWREKVDPAILKRMGVDKLLLKVSFQPDRTLTRSQCSRVSHYTPQPL